MAIVSPLDFFDASQRGYFSPIVPGVSVFKDAAGRIPATSDGDRVCMIADLSNNNNHALALYDSTTDDNHALLKQDGNGAWYLDTTNSIFRRRNDTAAGPNLAHADGSHTHFLAADILAITGLRTVMDQDASSGSARVAQWMRLNGSTVEGIVFSGSTIYTAAKSGLTTGQRVLSVRSTSALITARIDGVDGANVATGTRNVGAYRVIEFSTTSLFNHRYYGEFFIGETLSGADLTDAEAYYAALFADGTTGLNCTITFSSGTTLIRDRAAELVTATGVKWSVHHATTGEQLAYGLGATITAGEMTLAFDAPVVNGQNLDVVLHESINTPNANFPQRVYTMQAVVA